MTHKNKQERYIFFGLVSGKQKWLLFKKQVEPSKPYVLILSKETKVYDT